MHISIIQTSHFLLRLKKVLAVIYHQNILYYRYRITPVEYLRIPVHLSNIFSVRIYSLFYLGEDDAGSVRIGILFNSRHNFRISCHVMEVTGLPLSKVVCPCYVHCLSKNKRTVRSGERFSVRVEERWRAVQPC